MVYPKIQTLWKRDKNNKYCIIEGDYSRDEFKNIKNWIVTEKIDGTNIRIVYNSKNPILEFLGRTDNSQMPPFFRGYLQDIFDYDLFKKVFEEAEVVRLFGEGYGPKIQKGGDLYRDDVSLILFDIWIDGWWLAFSAVQDIAKQLNTDSVPCLGVMGLDDIQKYVKEKHNSLIGDKKIMEGLVFQPDPLMLFRDGTPIKCKLKIEDYEKLKC